MNRHIVRNIAVVTIALIVVALGVHKAVACPVGCVTLDLARQAGHDYRIETPVGYMSTADGGTWLAARLAEIPDYPNADQYRRAVRMAFGAGLINDEPED